MKILLWVLAAAAAIVLLGGVVFPILSWLLHSLGWLVAGVLVVGGGVWAAKKLGGGDKADDALVTGRDGQKLP